ncbi:hypothetical protein [Parabacteroides sp.]|uniref:hypothetical protein n=1 Tax=Parabacteroides sp. TaxID=1869337 RepID=UPI00257FFB88|nr:hypothetical protein [Parabacteroides sp.]
MKALLPLLLFVSLCTCCLRAQENLTDRELFEQMRQSMRKEYNEYRKENEREYANYLRQTWIEYQLHKGINPYKEPKPDTIPTAPKDEKKIIKEIPAKGNIEVPIDPVHEPDILLGGNNQPKGLKSISVPFYGTDYQLSHNLGNYILKSTKTKDIADTWETFGTPAVSQLVADLVTIKLENKLNDWAFFLLVEKTANQLPQLADSNTRILFRHFALFKCGYNIRIGLIGKSLILLVPFKEQINWRQFLSEKDTKYYLFTDHENNASGAVYTVPLSGNNSGRSFSLYIQEDIYLADQPVQLSRTFRKTKYTVTINSNRIDFLKDYPQCDFRIFAEAPVDPRFEEEILKQIAPQIEPLSTGDALNWLLHFTQSAFQYATDHAQFGHEEYLFPEETFFYPKSDCEDRAIFFAWIVRRTLNLEVALMSYKDHLATGVILDQDIKGTYIRTSDKRYLLCDPTYIGANIGQCMPRYKDERPEVLKLNQ